MANIISNSPKSLELVSTIDFFKRRQRIEMFILAISLSLMAIPLAYESIRLTIVTQSPPYLVLIIVLLLMAPTTFLHEIFHYIFQWLFTQQKPRLGFKFPYPYCISAPNTYCSRNQGVVCALAPFFFVTLILVLLSLPVNPLTKAILLAVTYLHAPTCSGDVLLTFWLLKHPRHMWLGTVGLSNALFQCIQNT